MSQENGQSRRVQRVEKELRAIIASYVIRNCPEGMFNVNGVKVSKDLRQAKVFVSQIGQTNVVPEDLEVLQEHGAEIQREIAKRLRMKYCPKIKFYNDESVAMSEKVDAILANINTNRS